MPVEKCAERRLYARNVFDKTDAVVPARKRSRQNYKAAWKKCRSGQLAAVTAAWSSARRLPWKRGGMRSRRPLSRPLGGASTRGTDRLVEFRTAQGRLVGEQATGEFGAAHAAVADLVEQREHVGVFLALEHQRSQVRAHQDHVERVVDRV